LFLGNRVKGRQILDRETATAADPDGDDKKKKQVFQEIFLSAKAKRRMSI
jgi:hypothetical protein